MAWTTAGDDVLCHEDAGEAFLLHVPSGRYFGLNATGLVVWKAIASGDDPVVAVRRQWPEVPEPDCRADVERLVASLAGAGLVRQTDAGA